MKDTSNSYGIDWTNIDMKSNYEKDQAILNAYSINDLLLEISCNIKTEDICKATIYAQAIESLESNMRSAKEVLINNLVNIRTQALKERKDV